MVQQKPSIPSAALAAAAPDSPVYKTIGPVELRLHLFCPTPARAAAPAIVFFFGGGWRGGSPNQFYPHCRYLARGGMLAAAEYRVEAGVWVGPQGPRR